MGILGRREGVEATNATAPVLSLTHSEPSRGSRAPRSTQSDNDRRRKPSGTSAPRPVTPRRNPRTPDAPRSRHDQRQQTDPPRRPGPELGSTASLPYRAANCASRAIVARTRAAPAARAAASYSPAPSPIARNYASAANRAFGARPSARAGVGSSTHHRLAGCPRTLARCRATSAGPKGPAWVISTCSPVPAHPDRLPCGPGWPRTTRARISCPTVNFAAEMPRLRVSPHL